MVSVLVAFAERVDLPSKPFQACMLISSSGLVQVVLQARRGQGAREMQQCFNRLKEVQRQLAFHQVSVQISLAAIVLLVDLFAGCRAHELFVIKQRHKPRPAWP